MVTAEEICMYSDAAKNSELGFGAICQNDWMAYTWAESRDKFHLENFIIQEDPSITYLELFAVTAGVLQWINRFANRRICLFCNNEGAVQIINRSSSRCENCMVLVRLLTLESMKHNVRISAKYVSS